MLKKLRNKMLLMNMVSTFCLILLAFSVIFAITVSSVERDIEESLFRAFSFHRPMPFAPRQDDEKMQNQEAPKERVLRDMRNFSVFVESDGTVRTDSMLGQNSEHYKSVAEEALRQNSERGEFRSEQIVWRFETQRLENGAKVIALADITAERGFLLRLIISFLICAAILLIIIFFISLYFANRAIAPVREAFEKQKQFVADASHELKTPLTAINANIDVLLSQQCEAVSAQEKWLRYIKSEVARLTDLTGSLLFMAKMDGDTHIEMQRQSISEIAEQTALNLEAVAYEKGIELLCDIEENLFIDCNAAQMTQLCIILFDNAVKYSPKNEQVTIRLCHTGKGVALSVHNNGAHIPREEQMKIFDRFYRVDKSRSSEGYGLGLAMAKEIVSIHKGKINVASSRESGTEFTVIFS